MLHLINSSHLNMRSMAISVLGLIGRVVAPKRAAQELLLLTNDDSVEIRVAAVDALGHMGEVAAGQSVIDRMIKLSSDSNTAVSSAAKIALKKIGVVEAGRLAFKWLGFGDAEMSSGSDDAEMILEQADSLVKSKESVAKLISLSKHPDSNIRAQSVNAIVNLGDVNSIPLVYRHRMRGHLEIDEAGEVITTPTPLTQESESELNEKIIERLLEMLLDEDLTVRCASALALAHVGESARSVEVSRKLKEFWERHLGDVEYIRVDEQDDKVCNVAYEEIRRIAAETLN